MEYFDPLHIINYKDIFITTLKITKSYTSKELTYQI